MYINREERKELEELSKAIFGKTNWYRKNLVQKGVKKTRGEVEANPESSSYKYFQTVEEVKEYMLLVQKNAKELMEKMVAEGAKNELSK